MVEGIMVGNRKLVVTLAAIGAFTFMCCFLELKEAAVVLAVGMALAGIGGTFMYGNKAEHRFAVPAEPSAPVAAPAPAVQ